MFEIIIQALATAFFASTTIFWVAILTRAI